MPPAALAELVKLIEDGRCQASWPRTSSGRCGQSGGRAADIVGKAEGLAQVSDGGELEEACRKVIAAHPEEADQLQGANPKLMGFFVGAV